MTHGWLSWAGPAVLVAAGYTLWLWFPLLTAIAAARLGRRHG